MMTLFHYNWDVRNDWFEWCKQVSAEELLRERTGGIGGILNTLFHIVVVEYSWICDLQGKPDFKEPFDNYNTLSKVKNLSETFHIEIEDFLKTWSDDMENKNLVMEYQDGEIRNFTYGEVLRHVLAHEIHHIGQLSVWARELDLKPISANLIGRGLAGIS